MKMKALILPLAAAAVCGASAQSGAWTLDDCLQHALEHSIEIQVSQNEYLSGLEDTREARAALFPKLSAEIVQEATYTPNAQEDRKTLGGSYGLNAEMTLFSGGRLRHGIRQQKLQNSRDSLAVAEQRILLRVAVVEAFMRCQYLAEAIELNTRTVAASAEVCELARKKHDDGQITATDLAQLESRYYADQYRLTLSRNSYDASLLVLQKLVEFEVGETMQLARPAYGETDILRLLPDRQTVFENVMNSMPAIRSGKLGIETAEIEQKSARAGYWPTVDLNAGLGTDNRYDAPEAFPAQLQDNFGMAAGITVSIPILTGRENKTAVRKARIELENSRLEYEEAEEETLRASEKIYQDVCSAQSQYAAAGDQETYARKSYELLCDRFAGESSGVSDLVLAMTDLYAAAEARLQAKYQALAGLCVLDIYQGR